MLNDDEKMIMMDNQKILSVEEDDPQTFIIIGAAMEVHRTLGMGFLEAVYQEALAFELKERKIPFK